MTFLSLQHLQQLKSYLFFVSSPSHKETLLSPLSLCTHTNTHTHTHKHTHIHTNTNTHTHTHTHTNTHTRLSFLSTSHKLGNSPFFLHTQKNFSFRFLSVCQSQGNSPPSFYTQKGALLSPFSFLFPTHKETLISPLSFYTKKEAFLSLLIRQSRFSPPSTHKKGLSFHLSIPHSQGNFHFSPLLSKKEVYLQFPFLSVSHISLSFLHTKGSSPFTFLINTPHSQGNVLVRLLTTHTQ